MTTSKSSTLKTTTLIAGLAVATFLVACGDKTDPRRADRITSRQNTEVVPASAQTGSIGDGVTPSPTAVAQGTPVEPAPKLPPTAGEVKQAWKEGVALYDGRDYEQAGSRLQIVVDARPNDAYAHYLLGLALWKSGHLVEAEAALATSSGLDGAKPKCWINLARVRMQRNDFTGALDAAGQGLMLDPGSADALHQRGRALAGLKRGDEALNALQQARAADPENGYIANTLGHFLLTAGRVDDSVPHLEAARDRLPEVAFVRNNLGMAYERQGDLDRAVEEYRAAVGAGDSEGKAAMSLARLEPILGPEKIAGNPKGEDTGPVEETATVGETAGGEPTADAGTADGSTTDGGGTIEDSSK